MNTAQAVGQRLKEARKDKGIKQEEAGKAINMIQTAYSRIERGVFQLNYDQMIALCKLYNCTSDYLLGLADI